MSAATSPVRVAIVGCTGRMGRALLRLAAADPALRVVAGVTIAGDPQLGRDAGAVAGIAALGISIGDSLEAECDVAIEFTQPASCAAWAEWCAGRRVALVSGTTGLEQSHRKALAEAAKQTPVLWSPNMSVGVNLLLGLVSRTAAALGDEWDIEIVEAHHGRKADAPSGTAKALLNAACEARGVGAEAAAVYGRVGLPGPRRRGEIGVHAVRLSDVVGEHDVHFGGAGERLTLSHRATSRDVFATGALRAAKWIAGKPAGLYTLRDVLAL